MFFYNFRIALLSVRQNPIISSLIVLAIGLGIGTCMTMLTIHYQLTRNHIEHKNDVLYAVMMDAGDPQEKPTEKPEDIAFALTYKDAVNLIEANTPAKRQLIMSTARGALQANVHDKAHSVAVRATYSTLFPMFDIPFLYGTYWSREDDDNARHVIVLNNEMNTKLFGNINSVGKRVLLARQYYEVIGVLDVWDPVPKPYHPGSTWADGVFIPFKLAHQYELKPRSITRCWAGYSDYSHQSLVSSECTWMLAWAELENEQQAQDYLDFLNRYAEEQKRYGRFQRPLNNFIIPVDRWIKMHDMVGDKRRTQLVLAVLFLVICMVNMVGLLLSKFISRAYEISLKRALGASRKTIFMQTIAEVSLIGFMGGLFGAGLAWLGLVAMKFMLGNNNNSFGEQVLRLDWNMLLMAIAIAVVSALVAGIYPAWRVCKLPPAQYLRIQ